MDGCRRKHLVSGLYCLLNRPEMGEQQDTSACSDGAGEPECPVSLPAACAPGCLLRDWEGAAPQAASCSEGGAHFRCVVGLLMAALPARSAQHPVLWSDPPSGALGHLSQNHRLLSSSLVFLEVFAELWNFAELP